MEWFPSKVMRCFIKTKMGSTFQHMLVRFKIYHLNTLLLLMELNCSHCFIQYDLHHKTHNGRTDYKLVVLSHCVTLAFWGSICYSFFFFDHPAWGIRLVSELCDMNNQVLLLVYENGFQENFQTDLTWSMQCFSADSDSGMWWMGDGH